MKSKKQKEKTIIVILSSIAILLLAIGLTSFYYERNLSKQNQKEIEQSNELQESNESMSDQQPEATPSDPISIPTDPPVVERPIPVAPTPTAIPPQNQNFQSEEDVIQYFKTQEQTLDGYQNQEDLSLASKAKNLFITVVDFLFYDQPIGGYTFSQLTNKAKIEILKIALSIDHKIDEYFPNYKNTIKQGYENIKAKAVKLYLDTTALLCEKVGDDTCRQAKEDFANMKKSFGFTFDLIKEAGGNLVDAIKTWYEIFSGKK